MRIWFETFDVGIVAHRRHSGIRRSGGSGAHPEVQNVFALFISFRDIFPIPIAEQKIADTGLLSNKAELEGNGRDIHIRKLTGERKTPGISVAAGIFLSLIHI